MILGGDAPLAIGERVVLKWVHTRRSGWVKDHPVVVLRAATKAEWLAWCRETDAVAPGTEAYEGPYFYEVTTD